MLKKMIAFLSVSLILVSLIVAREGKEVGIGDKAPEFTLKDAHDREHRLERLFNADDSSERVVILVMGDRKVRKEAAKWAMELDKICQKNKKVAALMVADVRGKPFFVTKGMVKRRIKGANLAVPMVLDWDGKVNKWYKAQRKKTNVFVVDGDGRICYRKAVLYSEEIVQDIQEKVRHILAKPLLSMNKNKHKARERAIASAEQ